MMLKVEELNEKIDLIMDDLNNKIELIIHQNEKIIRDLSSLKLTLPSDALARVEKYLKEVDDELNQSSSISITRIRRSMAWKEMLAQSISEEEIQRRVESFAGVHPSTGEQKSKKQLEGVAFRQLAKEKFGSIEPPPDFRTARELREEIYLQRWSS